MDSAAYYLHKSLFLRSAWLYPFASLLQKKPDLGQCLVRATPQACTCAPENPDTSAGFEADQMIASIPPNNTVEMTGK